MELEHLRYFNSQKQLNRVDKNERIIKDVRKSFQQFLEEIEKNIKALDLYNIENLRNIN